MSCNDCMSGACSRENAFKQRIEQILQALRCQYPSMYVEADFVRPQVVDVDQNEYIDAQPEVWVKLAESVPAFRIDKQERWFQAEIGIINQKNAFLVLPADLYTFAPDDHVIIGSDSFLVEEATIQMGVAKLKLNREKSRYAKPGRFSTVYRTVGIKARIL